MGSAAVRAEKHESLAYSGDVSALEAWEHLKNDANAVLVDVRTPPEWTFSGEPNLTSIGKEAFKISWKVFPSYVLNDRFTQTLKAAGIAADAKIFFLCRTGGRSLDAACAAATEGYAECYNIKDGFEGPLDASQHRGTVAGWKAANLPWGQG